MKRARLRGRRRQPGESLSKLADDVRLLVSRSYPGASEYSLDDYAMEAFIGALDHPLRSRVRDVAPKTVSQALSRALYLEAHAYADNADNDVSRDWRASSGMLDVSAWVFLYSSLPTTALSSTTHHYLPSLPAVNTDN